MPACGFLYPFFEVPLIFLKRNNTMKKQLFASAFALLAASAFAAPTLNIGHGDTSVKLDPIFVNALTTLKVTPGPIGYSRIKDGVAFFPVNDGDFDFGTAKGEISHYGGLSLKSATTNVELSDFIIDTSGASPILTGKVIVNDNFVARIPLFDLKLPALTLPLAAPKNGWGPLNVPGVKVTLSAGAATALNSVFNVTAFAGGIPIGDATVRTFAFGH
jgi:hypothetical protein